MREGRGIQGGRRAWRGDEGSLWKSDFVGW